MFKRAAAPATGRSPVASRISLLRSGEEWKSREVEGVSRKRLPVGRASRGDEVATRERLSVERGDVHGCGRGRATGGAAVGVRERLSVGREYVLSGGIGWASRGAEVGARKQVPVGHELGKCVLRSGTGWASRGPEVGER